LAIFLSSGFSEINKLIIIAVVIVYHLKLETKLYLIAFKY